MQSPGPTPYRFSSHTPDRGFDALSLPAAAASASVVQFGRSVPPPPGENIAAAAPDLAQEPEAQLMCMTIAATPLAARQTRRSLTAEQDPR